MKNLSIIIIFFLISVSGYSQFYIRNNLYNNDYYILNPAALNTETFKIVLNTNLSNVDFEDAPRTMGVTIGGSIAKNTSLGLKFTADELGAFRNNTILASYAYSLKLGKYNKHILSLGLSMGINMLNFKTSEIDAFSTDDPLLRSNYYEQTYYMGEIGMDYKWHNFQTGVSVPILLQQVESYIAYAAYTLGIPYTNFHLHSDFEITPMVLYQQLPERVSQVDGGLKIKYKIIWISGLYRTNNDKVMAIGFQLKKLLLAYSYGISNKNFSAFTSGNNNGIQLSYSF